MYIVSKIYTYIHVPAVFQDLENVISECISVLIQQAMGVIEHLSCVVPDAKLGIVHFRFHIVGIILGIQQ